MKKYLFTYCLLLPMSLLVWFPSFSQQSYQLTGNQQFTVAGTSTIHEWEMVAKEGSSGSAQLSLENGKLAKLTSVKIDLPVKSLKSGKGSMDNNAYDALEVEKYPSIKFEMTECLAINGNAIKAKGKLTIAGKSQIIPVEVSYSVSGNSLKFKGSFPILFSDYTIDAPTAVLGTIKTGDELTLAFEANFSPKN